MAKQKKITIAQILPNLDGGGVERGTIEMAQAIMNEGWQAVVITNAGKFIPRLTQMGVAVIQLPIHKKTPWGIWQNRRKLKDVLAAHKINLVHARSRAPAWVAEPVARTLKIPFVTTFHGTYRIQNRFKRWYNRIMTTGNPVIAISDFIAKHIQKEYGVEDKKIVTIPRGVDLKHFDPITVSPERVVKLTTLWQTPDDVPIIMLPGRLTRIKGHELLIEALNQIKDIPFHCVMVGAKSDDRYRHELMRLITTRNLNDKFRILDYCDDMPAAYMLADIVVCPSIVPEAFGRSAVEAMAMGRPVIASNLGGLAETVLPGQTGWLFKPGDAKDLAKKIRQALKLDIAERKSLAKRAMDHVKKNYTTETMQKATINVYRRALKL